jgi:hypothetical protein
MPSNRGTVEIRGLSQLIRAIGVGGAQLEDLRAANVAAGNIVADAARGLAPRASGAMASAIVAGTAVRRAVVSVPRIRYAKPVHVGWTSRGGRHIDGRPFLSQAAEQTEPRWVDAYLADLEKIVDQIGGSTG